FLPPRPPPRPTPFPYTTLFRSRTAVSSPTCRTSTTCVGALRASADPAAPLARATMPDKTVRYCPSCHSVFPSEFRTCPKDQTDLLTASELQPGMVLRGKYEILGKLGAGGMA